MKLATWNVNGIRAVVKKNFREVLDELDADVIGIQETKAQDDQVREALNEFVFGGEYHLYSSSAVKKGYSGTAILSRKEPLKVTAGLGIPEMDTEGRVLCATFEAFHFITVYTPNASSELKRLPFREDWDRAFAAYIEAKAQEKPVICCGDLNVAHQAIDLARPKQNYDKTPGYTQKEIDGFTHLLKHANLTDLWRHQHPNEVGYSWWSYRGGAREKNVGWRLDYFLVSDEMKRGETTIHREITGSDHCPVSLQW